jgi:hypothetical protein
MIEERNPWRRPFHRRYGLDSIIFPEGQEVSMLGEDEGSEEVAVHCHLRRSLQVPTNAIYIYRAGSRVFPFRPQVDRGGCGFVSMFDTLRRSVYNTVRKTALKKVRDVQ